MCGISSIVNKGKEKIDIVALKHMAAVMSYRGPDQSGFATFASETIGFAHVRLAIQDPFAEPQPLVVKLGQDVVALCYNGEIYDVEKQRELLKELGYSFQTTTDTEVVLNLYLHHGLEFTKLLNGEFAFLLYDSRSDRLRPVGIAMVSSLCSTTRTTNGLSSRRRPRQSSHALQSFENLLRIS